MTPPAAAKQTTDAEVTNAAAHRVGFASGQGEANVVLYQIGCGSGNEILSLFYKGAEMRIHFKFRGEFGHASGKVTFRKGTFVAESDGRYDRRSAQGVRVRKPTDEELKETEALMKYAPAPGKRKG